MCMRTVTNVHCISVISYNGSNTATTNDTDYSIRTLSTHGQLFWMGGETLNSSQDPLKAWAGPGCLFVKHDQTFTGLNVTKVFECQ